MGSAMTAAARPSRALFVATILTGSFLLFLVQPMVARMALPRLGGAPNVWNSAMLVYQALLLAGYFYAHRLSRLPFALQTKLHLALFAAAALTLPVGLIEMPSPAPGTEVFWVPMLLALSIGPVFFLVSAQAPLMQRWFSAHPAAGEPWPLYAASNLGSFGGLIAYPLLVEPLLSLKAQAWAWSAGYGLLLVLIALSARARRGVQQAVSAELAADPVPLRRVLMWLALAAVPSGLMLSTTTHLTTDLFAMPLLWVIPLGIYLLSFVFAFAENRTVARIVSALAWPVLLGAGGLAMISQGSNGLVPVLISVALLFFVCVALHARLYDLRPATGQLTYFYLIMSAGGALGGLFTALIAPLVFDWVWEHPLLVLAAALLLPRGAIPDWRRLKGLEPAMQRLLVLTLAFVIGALLWLLNDITAAFEESPLRWAYAGAIALLGLALVPWRALAPALLALTMYVQGGFLTIKDTRDGTRTRSYFGIYTVRDYPDQKLRTLAHGTTLHGEQSLDPKLSRTPLTYYGPGSGAGIAFSHARELFSPAPAIGVVGLGTGTLACFAQPGETWRFYEIDPAVLELSRNGTFTFVRDCAPRAEVVIGDARIELGKVRAGSLDLLAIDAFSSDSIPLHLLTDEAFVVYLNALSPRGILLVHISNRYIDLEPALAATVRARGLYAALRDDEPPEGSKLTGSAWIAISRDPAQLKALERHAPALPWTRLKPPAPRAWSDDHASILPFIRWYNFLGPAS
jgi:hypothetical protein